MMRRFIFFLPLLFVMASPVHAREGDGLRPVKAEGRQALEGLSRSLARTRAIEEAQKNAIRQVIQSQIPESVATENKEPIEAQFLADLSRYVGGYQIMGERLDAQEVVVTLTAQIREILIREDLKQRGYLELPGGSGGALEVILKVEQPNRYRSVVELRGKIQEKVTGVEKVTTSKVSQKEVILTLTMRPGFDLNLVKTELEGIELETRKPLRVSRIEDHGLFIQM